MSDTFEEFISRERDRLRGEREAVFNQQQELEQKLAAINKEMRAIDAYEAAKTGKALPAAARAGGRAPSAARRGSKREQLLQLIQQNPDGLARKDILDRLGLKGDRAGEMSVSNALTALTKSNQVARRDRKYVPV
ncbi:MAG: hypothetical protein ACM3JG_16075 [Thiohalocapsa sp.]